jgi:hypothetical protein
MPVGATFLIVGLTNGPAFVANPCLANQLRWARNHHTRLGAYALASYPSARMVRHHGGSGPYDPGVRFRRLRNTAYAEAEFNLATMRRLDIHVPTMWVDVEPYPLYPWSSSRAANRAVVRALISAYHHAHYRVGIYTNRDGWPQVVGHWRLPRYPAWSTVGPSSESVARRACRTGPSGGTAWMAQWWFGHWRHGAEDRDLLCPAAPRGGPVTARPL